MKRTIVQLRSLRKIIINMSILVLIFCILYPSSASANELSIVKHKKYLYTLTLEDLLKIKVISASKVEQEIKNAPGVISVITEEEIKLFGGANLFELLNRMPSVISSKSHSIDIVSIRGGEFSFFKANIAYLIDGIPIRNVGGNSTYYNFLYSFPISRIKQIEVIRGPASVQYGNYAFDGAINVITKKESDHTLNASGSVGQNNTYRYDVSGWRKIYDLQIHANYSAIKTDGIPLTSKGRHYEYATGDTVAPISDTVTQVPFDMQIPQDNHYYIVELKYNPITVFYQLAYSNKYVAQTFSSNFAQTYTQEDANHTLLNYTSHSTLLGIRVNHDIFDNVKLSGHLFRHVESFRWYIGSFNAIHTVGEELNAEATLHYAINQQLNIQSGVTYQRLTSGENSLTEVPYDFTYLAYMAEVTYKTKSFGAYVGFQYNKPLKYDAALVPRLSVHYNISDYLIAKYSIAQAFRSPSPPDYLYESHLVNLDSSITYLDKGNPNIKAEINTTNELQLLYQTSNVFATLTGYYIYATNLISTHAKDVDIGDTIVTYSHFKDNLGTRTSYGMEYEGKYHAFDSWYIVNSVVYNQNILNDTLVNYSLGPNYQGKLGVSYSHSLFTLASFFIYSDSYKELTSDRVPVENIKTINPQPNDNYDLSINTQIFLDRILGYSYPQTTVSILGRNLLDHQLWQPDMVFLKYNGIPSMEGRNVIATLKVTF